MPTHRTRSHSSSFANTAVSCLAIAVAMALGACGPADLGTIPINFDGPAAPGGGDAPAPTVVGGQVSGLVVQKQTVDSTNQTLLDVHPTSGSINAGRPDLTADFNAQLQPNGVVRVVLFGTSYPQIAVGDSISVTCLHVDGSHGVLLVFINCSLS